MFTKKRDTLGSLEQFLLLAITGKLTQALAIPVSMVYSTLTRLLLCVKIIHRSEAKSKALDTVHRQDCWHRGIKT